MTRRHWPATLIWVLVLAAPAGAQEEGGIDTLGPYDLIERWMQPPEEGWLLHPVAHFAESADRIFIVSSGATFAATAPADLGVFNAKVPGAKQDHHLLVVNRDGRVIERWTRWYELLRSPHAVRISPYDPEKHVWVADRASHQVLKFTNDGTKLVMAVGTRGEAGSDEKHLGRPTDIAFLPDGTFFVTDGEDSDPQRRIVKFDRNGRFLLAWSTLEGPLAGFESNLVHGIAVDARRRVYVAQRGGGRNRGQGRVLRFDEHGKYLAKWEGFAGIERIWIAQDGFVWVQEGSDPECSLVKLDADGKRLSAWRSRGTDISVDPDGNLYIQVGRTMTSGRLVPGGRIEKFAPKRNADRSQLVGRMVTVQ